MCYYKLPTLASDTKMHTTASNCWTGKASQLFNRITVKLRKIKRVPHLSYHRNHTELHKKYLLKQFNSMLSLH